jgi:polysaccharide export outer membrane protein
MNALRPLVIVSLLVLLNLSACRTGEIVSSGEVEIKVPRSVLGPDDTVEIKVYLEDSLSSSYEIDSDGLITFPLLGSVSVAGLTPAELAERIRTGLLEGFLRDPQVTVVVVEFNSRQVSIIGEVKKPGRYAYRDGMTLVQAIADAGGTTGTALLSSMQVTRTTASSETTQSKKNFVVPFKDITLGRAPDFPLLPGDVVVVQESAVR